MFGATAAASSRGGSSPLTIAPTWRAGRVVGGRSTRSTSSCSRLWPTLRSEFAAPATSACSTASTARVGACNIARLARSQHGDCLRFSPSAVESRTRWPMPSRRPVNRAIIEAARAQLVEREQSTRVARSCDHTGPDKARVRAASDSPRSDHVGVFRGRAPPERRSDEQDFPGRRRQDRSAPPFHPRRRPSQPTYR